MSESAARSYPPSQNLPGLVLRWAGDGAIAGFAAAILCTGVLAATALVAWPRGRSRGWSAAQSAATIAAVLLVNPRTWYHHYAILTLPFALILSRPAPLSAASMSALGAAFALVQAFGLGWRWLAANRIALESATLGASIVWAAALLLARRDRDQAGSVGTIVNGRQ